MTEETHNQIAELKKLSAKKRLFKIPKEPKEGQERAEIYITPLSLDDMEIMEGIKDDAPIGEMVNQTKKLIAHCLGVEVSHIKTLSFEFLNDIMDAIEELNNMQEKDRNKIAKVKAFIKQKKDASAAQPSQE